MITNMVRDGKFLMKDTLFTKEHNELSKNGEKKLN